MSAATQPAKAATAARNTGSLAATGGDNGTGSPATLGFSIQLLATNIFAGSTGSPSFPSTSSASSQPSPQMGSPNPSVNINEPMALTSSKRPVDYKGGVTQAANWESDPGQMVRCVFCGGGLCRSCSKDAVLLCEKPAITGLHSDWITPDVLAMQRPSSRGIKEHNIMRQFVEKGIRAIFNCTMVGEHPYCGDGILEKSGFSYDPEEFQAAGIEYYNFGWEDMTAPTILFMQDAVRVASSVMERGGKIAVHCHAGFGRTGLLIASVLMLRNNLSPAAAINTVRTKRPRSIQTKFQEAFVSEFGRRLCELKTVYRPPALLPSPTSTPLTTTTTSSPAIATVTSPTTTTATIPGSDSTSYGPKPMSYVEALNNQTLFLHADRAIAMRWIVQPVYMSLRALLNLSEKHPRAVAAALSSVTDTSAFGDNLWGLEEELLLQELKDGANANKWEAWEEGALDSDPRIPAQLLFDFLSSLSAPLLVHDVAASEIAALVQAGVFGSGDGQGREEVRPDYSGIAARLTAMNGCHHGVLSTIEKVVLLLRRLRDAQVDQRALHRAYQRMGLALMQMDKALGPSVLNGRDMVHVPVYATFKSTVKTVRMVGNESLSRMVYSMDLLDKFMTVLVEGWAMVPKNMVGTVRTPGRYNSYLKPIGLLEEEPEEGERADCTQSNINAEEGPDCTQSNIHTDTATLLEDTQAATPDTCGCTGSTGPETLRSSVSALRSPTTSLACDQEPATDQLLGVSPAEADARMPAAQALVHEPPCP